MSSCRAPVFRPSSGLACFFLTILYLAAIAILTVFFSPKRFPQIKCQINRLKFRMRYCQRGNSDPTIDLSFDLDSWLSDNENVANAIVWQTPQPPDGVPISYPDWSDAQKAELSQTFWDIRFSDFAALPDPPPTTFLLSAHGNLISTNFDQALAWKYYIAYVAQSLVVENAVWVSWSITGYSAEELTVLLDSRSLFSYSNDGTYHIGARFYGDTTEPVGGYRGVVTPSDPVSIFGFLRARGYIGSTTRATIERLLDWCRDNLVHYYDTDGTPNDYTNHWQYAGFPPIIKIISGTARQQGRVFGHYTAGCWGTSGFLRTVLRTVNIPVKIKNPCGHAEPHFVRERLYLSHGDDPYNRISKWTPRFPIGDLLIDQARFDTWFGSGVPSDQVCKNIGRQVIELALRDLPYEMLRLYCDDMAAGRTHAGGRVYSYIFQSIVYTVADLESMNLWARMDAKIANLGGCSNIPSSITAAITAPASGSTVSGSVTVNMAVSGQTVTSNTFKLELQGNQLFNQTVAGLTASYTWNTLDWTNGSNTLTLTVTDSVGNSASASITVTISNSITAAITAPASGSTVSGSVTVNMAVSGQTVTLNVFNLKVDGNQVFNQAVAGLTASYNWNTTTVSNGAHTLTLTVTDAVSKTATASISTNVAN